MNSQLRGILLLTFRELWAKKIIVGLFIISTLVWIFLSFALNLDVVEGSLAGIRIFGQEAVSPEVLEQPEGEGVGAGRLALKEVIVATESLVAGLAYWMGTLLALFATAPLFTGLLERGHVDLLLSKPYSRNRLLAGHVLGVLLVMLLLACYLLGSVWLVMSLKTGIWNLRFLLSIPILVAMFGVIYSVIVFMGVWTESTALSLIVAYAFIFFSIILAFRESLAPQIGPFWRPVYLGFYHVFPNFSEVTGIITHLSEGAVGSWYPFVSSLLFGAVLYGAAFAWFNRRDF